MHLNTLALKRMPTRTHDISNLSIEWIGKSNMANNAFFEESERSNTLGTIDNLVRDDEISGSDLLLKRTDGREGNDSGNTNLTESSNVGAGWDLVRGVFVVGAVAGEEGYWGTIVLENRDWRGCGAPWCLYVENGNRLVVLELLKTGATDDGNADRACESL